MYYDNRCMRSCMAKFRHSFVTSQELRNFCMKKCVRRCKKC